jgi:glutamate racemase
MTPIDHRQAASSNLEIPEGFLRFCVLAWRRRWTPFPADRHEKDHQARGARGCAGPSGPSGDVVTGRPTPAYHGPVAISTADPRARPIAVYDSGVGGLTVLHELLVQLPHEDFVYLADAARLPYGMRTQAELERFALECAEELLARRAKLLVVACNTATSAALPVLRERMAQTTLGIDVLGVVQPGAVQAVAATTNGRVGLMATPATVASGAYAEAIALADPFVELTAVACPDLATIIEGGFPFDERVVETVRDYVAPLRAAGVDTVILGCTHYPLIAPMLQRMLGRGVRIVTSGTPVAHQVEHVLGARGLANPRGAAEGDYRFLTTGDVEAFRALGSVFLQLPLGAVERVALRAAEAVA